MSLTTKHLAVAHAQGVAPWGFLVPPRSGAPGVAVFAQVEMSVRVQPSAGPAGAWSAQGSREAAEGAAFILRLRGTDASLRATLHCPTPRRLFAARGAALLGAIAAARSLGEDPGRRNLCRWAEQLELGWSPAPSPGQMLGAWLTAAAPAPDALWDVEPESRLAVCAAQARPAILESAPQLAPIWSAAEPLGALGLTFDPCYGHVAVIFPGGNAPPAACPGTTPGRIGLGYAWI